MLAAFTTYLVDLDGVVYRGEELLPGAREFVEWLNATHKKYLFLTNNSFASEAQVLAKLTRLGIATDGSHILGAARAAVHHIARRFPAALVYVVGEQPLKEIVRSHGLRVADDDEHHADVVLVGLDRAFTYQKLTAAVLSVLHGAAFVAINRDPLLPIAQGFVAGTGTLVAAIEAGSGVSPEVVGKPQPTLLQEAMRQLGSLPSETLMIGDNLNIDIKGGQAAGTYTLLVLCGRDNPTTLAQSAIRPSYVYENLAAVMSEIEKEVSSSL
ncbi:MAG: HAD-IIA family hydrolase [Ktedonobacteraceae bacterium]|nr:HAD-IIA family hydrolase [Ktedonobacteraceae bacterium]